MKVLIISCNIVVSYLYMLHKISLGSTPCQTIAIGNESRFFLYPKIHFKNVKRHLQRIHPNTMKKNIRTTHHRKNT